MKIILTILYIGIAVIGYGQTSTIIQGNTNTKVINRGWLQVDSGLIIPTRDTNNVNMNLVIFNKKLMYKSEGSWLSASTDNQTISRSLDTLSISGGNSINLPLYPNRESYIGISATSITLQKKPESVSSIMIMYNNAFLDPADWSITNKIINLNFQITTSDLITIYYK